MSFSYIERSLVYAPHINPHFLNTDSLWVSNTFNSLSKDERIAQLFMIAAYSNKNEKYEEKLLNTVKKYRPGGIIFFQGTAQRQAFLTNKLQNTSKTPMLIGIDAETGLGARLSDCINFPKQMYLGAMEDKTLIYDMGREIGRQCKTIGVHINFAPVADINNNPKNPVINIRSFGENKIDVAKGCIEYMNGLQDQGIIAVAKHFPGHGDTDTDSHKALPIINHDINHLKNNELYPFIELINRGIQGVMTAHISLPMIDKSEKAASLSKILVTDILKKKLGFKGLCFTDAMNMKAVCKKGKEGEVNVEALLAGNDVLLFPSNLKKAIQAVKKAIQRNVITQELIDEKCKKILAAKYYCGLNNREQIYTLNLDKVLNTRFAKALNEELISQSICLIKNKNNIIPIRGLDTLNIASLAIGSKSETVFQRTLSLYTKIDHYNSTNLKELVKNIDEYNLIIVNAYGKYSKYKADFIDSLASKKKLILNYPRTPYGLSRYSLGKISGISLSFRKDSLYEAFAAQGIFGGINLSGKLPVTINKEFKYNTGISTNKSRIGYLNAEQIGMNASLLRDSIDSLANFGISQKAYPGCQVLVIKDGYVVHHKSYGYFTYDRLKSVDNNSIYDIASLTKITATLPSIMKLYDADNIKLEKKIVNYLPEYQGSDKANMNLKNILLHQAGLKAYIFLFKNFINEEYLDGNLFYSSKTKKYNLKLAPRLYVNRTYTFKDGIFNKNESPLYKVKVAPNMYMNIHYIDTIQKYVHDSKLKNIGKYQYSDLGFIILKNLVEKRTNIPFEDYCHSEFYKKLGANNTDFLPLNHMSINNIIPSSYDEVFRKDTLKGYVHDPFASLLGGVSGNAGLFSNANDIAKIMYIYMNEGQYGDEYFFDNQTINLFTSRDNLNNRRGLGFDKPDLDNKKNSPACFSASAESFGHSGFTGTLAWCDPTNNTIFVFLSNRTFPDETNNKLVKLNLRTNIQEIIYKSIKQDL
jgi:beta-glucosidase-like glycosyl hydrolase/CubicO group peptidase (beta-lactamase class C family)